MEKNMRDWFLMFGKIISVVLNSINIAQSVLDVILLVPIPRALNRYIRKNRLKKVLGFTRKEIPVFVEAYSKEFVNFDYAVITFESAKAIIKLQKCINDLNLILDFQNDGLSRVNYDAICIGGPSANPFVNSLFQNHFGKLVKFVGEVEPSYFKNTQINVQNLKLNSNFWGMQIKNRKFKYIENVQDYAFIVKLDSSDFNDKTKRSILCFFGIEIDGTTKAVEYFIESHDYIYKKFKDKHFFIALKVNLPDKSIDTKVGMIDLTDDVFNNKTHSPL